MIPIFGVSPGLVRRLNEHEKEIAQSVFGDTLPLEQVRVTVLAALGGRGFTSTVPPFSPWVWRYAVNVGPYGFAGLERSYRLRRLLVHELVHVWQGYHARYHSGFMVKSILHQTLAWVRRGSAYRYEPGKPWESYFVEQQAQLIEDWYGDGLREADQRFRYVHDHLRRP